MKRFSFSGLRGRLLLLGLVAVMPALELTIASYFEERRLVLDRAKGEALKVAQFVSRDYDDLLEGARQLLVALAQLSEVRAARGSRCSEMFANLLTQYQRYSNFGAVDAQGELYCSGLPVDRKVNLSDQPWFERAIEQRTFVVSEYVIGYVSGKPSITFAYPVVNGEGQAQGAVFAGLDLQWVARLVGQWNLPIGATLIFTDRKGTVLVQHPGPADWVGKVIPAPGLFGTILARREGVTDVAGPKGSRRLLGFAAIGTGSEPPFYVVVEFPSSGVFAEVNRAFRRDLAWLGVVILLVVAVIWIGSDIFILRHVNSVLAATKRVAAGDLAARTGLAASGQGELEQLGRAFDEMAASLEKAQKEKADFSAMVVHDLRSPLTAVTGAASLLAAGLLGPMSDEQQKWATKILANARRLSDLTDDFLDLSKLESGHIKLAKEEMNLRQLIETSLDNYAVLAVEKHISLTTRVDSPFPGKILVDPRRLDQVFSNLLSNAIKFTPEGGAIEVGAALENKGQEAEIRLWVKDNGAGIAAHEIPDLFRKYRQTASGKSSQQKGTGLGLVICKMIVEAHGGRIWVESEEGRGTTFLFILPLETHGAPGSAAKPGVA